MTSIEEKRLNEVYNYCDAVLAQPRTKGGLWYDDGLSVWVWFLIDMQQMQLVWWLRL